MSETPALTVPVAITWLQSGCPHHAPTGDDTCCAACGHAIAATLAHLVAALTALAAVRQPIDALTGLGRPLWLFEESIRPDA